jgi:copper(I)-binding protein
MKARPELPRLLAVALALFVVSCSSADGVTVSDVWSRPVPPVSPASAIFLEITNGLDTAVTLTGATSDACGSMELHESTVDDAGVMTMRPLVDGLRVEPGTSGLLAPGGIHVMCIEPQVFEGSFDVELTIDGADAITATVAIEDR